MHTFVVSLVFELPISSPVPFMRDFFCFHFQPYSLLVLMLVICFSSRKSVFRFCFVYLLLLSFLFFFFLFLFSLPIFLYVEAFLQHWSVSLLYQFWRFQNVCISSAKLLSFPSEKALSVGKLLSMPCGNASLPALLMIISLIKYLSSYRVLQF